MAGETNDLAGVAQITNLLQALRGSKARDNTTVTTTTRAAPQAQAAASDAMREILAGSRGLAAAGAITRAGGGYSSSSQRRQQADAKNRAEQAGAATYANLNSTQNSVSRAPDTPKQASILPQLAGAIALNSLFRAGEARNASGMLESTPSMAREGYDWVRRKISDLVDTPTALAEGSVPSLGALDATPMDVAALDVAPVDGVASFNDAASSMFSPAVEGLDLLMSANNIGSAAADVAPAAWDVGAAAADVGGSFADFLPGFAEGGKVSPFGNPFASNAMYTFAERAKAPVAPTVAADVPQEQGGDAAVQDTTPGAPATRGNVNAIADILGAVITSVIGGPVTSTVGKAAGPVTGMVAGLGARGAAKDPIVDALRSALMPPTGFVQTGKGAKSNEINSTEWDNINNAPDPIGELIGVLTGVPNDWNKGEPSIVADPGTPATPETPTETPTDSSSLGGDSPSGPDTSGMTSTGGVDSTDVSFGYAMGGLIAGGDGIPGKDDQIIKADGGEFMVRNKATSRIEELFGPKFLHYLNNIDRGGM